MKIHLAIKGVRFTDGTEVGVCESAPASLQVFHKHNKIKSKVKKLDIKYSIVKVILIKS